MLEELQRQALGWPAEWRKDGYIYQVSPIMNVEEVVGTESKSAWPVIPSKNSEIKIHRKKVYKFQTKLMKDVQGVAEKRFLTYKIYVSMGNNSVKNSSIKNSEPYAHFPIIGSRHNFK